MARDTELWQERQNCGGIAEIFFFFASTDLRTWFLPAFLVPAMFVHGWERESDPY